MAYTEFTDEVTKGASEAGGSDQRLNVSSRTDGRMYYNSRDRSKAFSFVFNGASAAAGDMVAYWKNSSSNDETLVIEGVGVNSVNAGSFKLHLVTGVASGTTVTPFCLNQVQPKTSSGIAECSEGGAGAITGLTSSAEIDHAAVGAYGHEEFRLRDSLRLGQDKAIAIEFEQGTTGRVWGVIFGYYEKTKV